MKETERPKFRPSKIVERVNAAGYPNFTMYDHTKLVDQINARQPGQGSGVSVANTWYWYENWFEKIIEKLEEGWTRP